MHLVVLTCVNRFCSPRLDTGAMDQTYGWHPYETLWLGSDSYGLHTMAWIRLLWLESDSYGLDFHAEDPRAIQNKHMQHNNEELPGTAPLSFPAPHFARHADQTIRWKKLQQMPRMLCHTPAKRFADSSLTKWQQMPRMLCHTSGKPPSRCCWPRPTTSHARTRSHV